MSGQVQPTVAATGAFNFFMPIAKVDKAKRTVSGYASTPSIDSDGEIVSLKAVKEALPGYMEYGNIREMHKSNSAVGTTQEANIDEKGLYITAKIVDDAAWKKCQEGVYKGFSIGGQKLAKSGNVITKIDMAEISVVDRPANPDAKFNVVKMVKTGEEATAVLVKVRKPLSAEGRAAMQLAKTVKNLIKANGEDEPEGTEESGVAPVQEPVKPEPIVAKAPEGEALGKIKGAKIKKGKKASRLAKAQAAAEALDLPKTFAPEPEFLNLRLGKGLGTAASLTYAFGSVRDAQRSLMLEGKDEKDSKDTALATRLGYVAKELAGVIGDKALHEGEEAVTMTDIDDRWVNQTLGKDKGMSKVQDMVNNAVLALLTGGEGALAKADNKPTMLDCLKGVKDNMKEAKKARKGAMESIEKAHGMCKVNFLAKAAKAKDKDSKDDDSFDPAECMKALNVAYTGMQKAANFEKAAKDFLAKADSMASVSVTSGNAEYIVPAGVKELAQSKLTEGMPPMMPDDGSVYAGKARGMGDLAKYAKGGMVSVEVAELLAKNAQLEGQVEFMGNMPRGGSRPHAFNLNKVNDGFGGTDAANKDAVSTMFKGVDVGAIGSGDENAHKTASAKAIGNLILAPQLGKSIFDASFKGTAGIGRQN